MAETLKSPDQTEDEFFADAVRTGISRIITTMDKKGGKPIGFCNTVIPTKASGGEIFYAEK